MASLVQKGDLEERLSGEPGEAVAESRLVVVNQQLGD